MESKIKHSYDDLLKLRAIGSVAVVADNTSTLVDINRIAYGRGDVTGRYGEGSFDIVFYASAGLAVGSDNVYVLKINTYDADGANATLQESITLTAADLAVRKTFKLDTATLKSVDADAAKVGIVMDVTGTTPSVTYYAFVAPNCLFG